MPIRAKLYIWTIIAAGSFGIIGAAILWSCQAPTKFLACLCLAALAATFKVKLPGMESCVSPSFVPLLFAAGTMSWQEAVVMAAVAGAVQTVWKPKGRIQAIQVAFNSANLAVSMAFAFGVSHNAAPNQVLVQLGIAALIYEVVNTVSVSTVINLLTQAPLAGIWRNCHLWTFPYQLAGGLVAALWIQTDLAMGVTVTVIGAVALYLMSSFYQELVNRTAPPEQLLS